VIPPPVFTTQEEVDAYLDAQRDVAVGGTRGVARGLGIVDLFAGVPWLAAETYGHQALDSLLAQEKRLDKQEYEKLQRLKLRSEGLLGQQGDDEEAKKKTKKRARARINPLEAETYDEAIKNFLDTTFPFETNENTQLAENAAFWTTLGVDGAFLLKAVVQAAPKGYAFVRNAIKNIGKNMDEADQAVMKTQKAFSEKTVDKPVPLLTDQRVDKVDEILKRMEKRNKKMAVEADKEAAKIKKEYADMGIEEFTENNKQFVTKPDGMSDEEALKKTTEMFKRQTAARESVRKKWANSDTAKDDVAEYNRELKYWKDRRKKQSADFQPSDKLNKALFEDYPEILTPQKREALAERFINNPEYRTLQKELKEAKRSVDERFRAGEIGEAEFHKQTVLLTDKTNKKTEKLLLDQIKSEVEFTVSSDPLKIYEDIVLRKGDYKDITRHLKGGSVQNSVDYALEQWS